MIPFLKLKDYCLTPTSNFFGNKDYLYYDFGSPILAVCHLDTVADFGKKTKIRFEKAGDVVTSIALDDRLGAWMISQLFNRGLRFDVLFTKDEEMGNSTAKLFTPVKDYNWMFSFDRRGIQPVLYQYDNSSLVNILYRFGYDVTYGSYSDIADLEQLGVCGINFGAGYFNEHTADCMTDLRIVKALLAQFTQFFIAMQDTKLAYKPEPKKAVKTTGWTYYNPIKTGKGKAKSYGAISQWDDDDWGTRGAKSYGAIVETECAMCGIKFNVQDLTEGRCPDCNKYLAQSADDDWKDRFPRMGIG